MTDWNCGSHAYNGHRGTDIGIGGFAAMDAGSQWIVAAAAGQVAFAVDGCFDRCTSGRCDCGAGFGNYVKVTHPDGKSTFYGHMKNGTVQVRTGDTVTCGQRLGKVGSSGWSTGPHLHFEPRYDTNRSDDPFGGPCGGPVSFWVEQGAYDDLPANDCEQIEPETGFIEGVVFDRSRSATPDGVAAKRLAGVVVRIGDVRARTDPDGVYGVDVPAGAHTVTASVAGYRATTVQAEVGAGREITTSIGLWPVELQVELLDALATPAVVHIRATPVASQIDNRVSGAEPTGGGCQSSSLRGRSSAALWLLGLLMLLQAARRPMDRRSGNRRR